MNLIKRTSVICANKLTCIIFILPFSFHVLKLIYGSRVSKKLGNELVHVQVHVCAGSCVCMCIYIPRPEVSRGHHFPEVLCLVLRQSLTRT